jgi:hypothetical protein
MNKWLATFADVQRVSVFLEARIQKRLSEQPPQTPPKAAGRRYPKRTFKFVRRADIQNPSSGGQGAAG